AAVDLPADVTGTVQAQRRVGRGRRRRLVADRQEIAVRIAQPEASLGRLARWIHLAHTGTPDRLEGGMVVVAGGAEGQVVQALAGTGIEPHSLPRLRRRPQMHGAV